MQVLDEKKREKILNAAATLFAARQFHMVLLSDVARAAGVGKGTLYIYFKSKEELFASVLTSAFDRMLEQFRARIDNAAADPKASLRMVIEEMVAFAYRNPQYLELMRAVAGWETAHRDKLLEKRLEVAAFLEKIIRRGVAKKVFVDPHPELTARFIPALVRSVLLEGRIKVKQRALTAQILRFVFSALAPGGGA